MKIIFTNGCFDILHIGHVKLLQYCHELAYQTTGGPGKVVVGLNSTRSVRRLKGNSRPINGGSDRKYILESLKYVDEVIIFDEDTPYQLIKQLSPHIIVKGGDYSPEDVVGCDIAEVKIFNTVDGISTTDIVNRLK
tara:strand:+ start:3075 stop:3482 length:408 start_codon:yes stop_codon:yes gene_type:complete